jgi:hypothetical protein
MFLTLMLMTGSVLFGSSPAADGLIEGTVVRAGVQTPVPNAGVALRAKLRGEMVLLAETVTNAQGRFRFDRLPLDAQCVYVPGANHGGIHYPGPSVCLTSRQPRAAVQLLVYDAVAFPNPLVTRRHKITLQPQLGALQVTESMLIDNPSGSCYIGQAVSDDAEQVTLQLAVPAAFQQITFDNEFFGRRFSLVDGKLTTGVPWPPGQRELTFTYFVPNAQGHFVWQRPLDLPSENVQVSVRTDDPATVKCNLSPTATHQTDEIAFAAGPRTLESGYLLNVELGRLPISPMTYAPAGAILLLVSSVLVTSVAVVRRRGRS